jgi:hypothetical protein
MLAVLPSHGIPLDEMLRSLLSPDASDVVTEPVTADGVPGLKASFRFGGMARFGEIYAFENEGQSYAATFTAGALCEPEGFPLLEPAVFDHALKSLSIQP